MGHFFPRFAEIDIASGCHRCSVTSAVEGQSGSVICTCAYLDSFDVSGLVQATSSTNDRTFEDDGVRAAPSEADIENMKPMQVIIPMAGAGDRFKKAGYSQPKPLIDVCGKPLIERLLANFPKDWRFVFIPSEEHLRTTNIKDVLLSLIPSA